MNLSVIAPEILLVSGALLVLLIDLASERLTASRLPHAVALLAVLAALAVCLDFPFSPRGAAFAGFFANDALALFLKPLVLGASLLTLVMAFRQFDSLGERRPVEFMLLLLVSTAGASALVSSRELVTLYVSLETMTFGAYLLAAYLKRDAASHEAGLKYVLLGAFSSAILLFGFSYLYGLSGTTRLTEMGARLAAQGPTPALVLALAFVLAGLGFKVAMVPFHLWAPDVYQGSPVAVTAYLSVASKTAGLAALIVLLMSVFATPTLSGPWSALLGVLALLSIVLGNLAAIPQTSLKRMMAYSSIAQAGYLLLGLMAADPLGLTALLYYLAVYLFTNFGAFLAIGILAARTGGDDISNAKGLAGRSPLLAAALLVSLLSLAGIPPLAGFTGKWYLFSAALQNGQVAMVLLAIVFSVVSLYYYLQVIRQAYIGEAPDPSPLRLHPAEGILILLCVAATVFFGVYPEPLMRWAETAARSIF